ncbi:hypothetical protein B0H21DRAFT_687727 [Amylocystis lapponica]|nr:hypothetical protein B0H21DRAFT_687727 [Amylocystis lapponica]
MFEDTLYGASALAALARTCRAFQDVALDILWRTLPNLAPLIKCFPTDVWKELPVQIDSGLTAECNILLVKEPEASDFTRFLSYAARIRELRRCPDLVTLLGTSVHHTKVSGAVFSTLLKCQQRVPGPYFPNLRRFEWQQHNDANDDASLFLLLLNPKVADMSMHLVLPIDETVLKQIDSALRQFAQNSPRLENLTLICPLSPNLVEAASRIILNHDYLRSVNTFNPTLSPLSLEVILHLAQLPMLEKLSLRCDASAQASAVQTLCKSLHPVFPALRHLVIYSENLSGCSTFLDVVHSSRLEHFHAITLVTPTALELQVFLTKLTQHAAHGTLAIVNLTSGLSSPRDAPAYTLTDDTLRPLLTLRRIREFKIALRNPLMLDNAFVHDLARAWPDLHTLELGTEWRREHATPGVTLKGLIPLVQHCPALEMLGIAVDTDVAEIAADYALLRPGRGASNSKVVMLLMGTSRLDEDREARVMVAGFLSDLFPRVRFIDSAWGHQGTLIDVDEDDADDEEHKMWEELQGLVRELGKIRVQERNWAARARTVVEVKQEPEQEE